MSIYRSFAWMGLAVAVTKASTLITQIILGYLLAVSEYGQYAYIVGALALVSGFADTGINKFLIKEQERLSFYLSSARYVAFLFACIGGGLLIGYFLYSKTYGDVFVAMALIAIFLPCNALAQIYKAKLAIQLDFSYISKVDMLNSALYSFCLVFSASVGMGVVSFGIALAASYLFMLLMYRGRSKKNSLPVGENKSGVLVLIKELRWLILTTFFMGLALRGDYLVLGFMIDQEALGYYFFAFMLVANIGLVMAQGINNVFMPYLVRHEGDDAAQELMFVQKSIMFILVTSLMSIGFILFGKDAIAWVWQGKWESAAIFAGLFSITLPLKMLAPAAYALLESKGYWREKFWLIFMDAISVLLAVSIGAQLGGVFGAAYALALQRGVVGVVIYWSAARLSGIAVKQLIRLLVYYCLPILLLSISCFYVIYGDIKSESILSGYLTIKLLLMTVAGVGFVLLMDKAMPTARPAIMVRARSAFQSIGK
ncbi:oligosaccharide flippase family protein [Stutzerimonas tarimensis]|uniref:Oligosaccharide flippase family protein n=1 Tax=Stutzerimonas tarimensis TaxID=1507735 RepID=A0ABV7T670_9GAMM